MTTFDRIEPQLPQLMDELAPARVPDYFDDMLRQSARTRQRPRWRSLEGWLPVDASGRTAPLRVIPWRPILVAALLLFAATLMVVLYAGSQRTVPRPFGNGPNGLILYSANGDIAAFDPDTGETRVVVGGPEQDDRPIVSPDGRSMLFSRATGSRVALWVAAVDGSDAREMPDTGAVDGSIDWSPSGDRIVVAPHDSGVPRVVDVASGSATELTFAAGISSAMWRPGHNELLVTAVAPDATRTFSLVGADGTGQRLITTAPGLLTGPSMSADGSLLAYSTWKGTIGGEGRLQIDEGRLHVIAIDGGADVLLTPAAADGYTWQFPALSPDGTHVVAVRFVSGSTTDEVQVGVIAIADPTRPVILGKVHSAGEQGAQTAFSPDGTLVMVTYSDDDSTWIYPVEGGAGRELPESALQHSWARWLP